MKELHQLEHRIKAMVEMEEYPEEFPEQLQTLVAARHEMVKTILADEKTLTRQKFDEVQQRTREIKHLLEKNRSRIKDKLLIAKKGKKSVSIYQMYQK
ncbi:flagellar biosynthesis protein FliS [Photobacterium ganghwense]|uniref:flagellar biosynthesis protein FliS n=1 Tax=Photobacterium ganghwense TaxID=320778 RepID=UPI001C2D7FBA|nr:flagellar biosynthesis protein FliS [Photobacterium ganghwense]MBV1840651.1 flagellar biosynthesis protein FliS [Photobacterium ganghwense]